MKYQQKLTSAEFDEYVNPYLSKAKRGYVCPIVALYKFFSYILYFLYTGCQWEMISIDKDPDKHGKGEISWQAVYHHFRKRCKDGSLRHLWAQSTETIRSALNLSDLNLNGTHTIAQKGGNSVKYQGRKKAKTGNILPILDKNGYPMASTEIIAGNLFKDMKQRRLPISGSYFNADSAFDTKAARKVCFNYGVLPNIAENRFGCKKAKRRRKRLFYKEIYKNRFGADMGVD